MLKGVSRNHSTAKRIIKCEIKASIKKSIINYTKYNQVKTKPTTEQRQRPGEGYIGFK